MLVTKYIPHLQHSRSGGRAGAAEQVQLTTNTICSDVMWRIYSMILTITWTLLLNTLTFSYQVFTCLALVLLLFSFSLCILLSVLSQYHIILQKTNLLLLKTNKSLKWVSNEYSIPWKHITVKIRTPQFPSSPPAPPPLLHHLLFISLLLLVILIIRTNTHKAGCVVMCPLWAMKSCTKGCIVSHLGTFITSAALNRSSWNL